VPPPRIIADSLHSPVVTTRQVDEGLAVANYTAAGSRVTGSPPANSGITAVLLGDSYVVAREVADHETMGSQLERLARDNGLPLDVRQYGWNGASPAQFLYVANDVLTRWRPRHVIVVLSSNDLDGNTLTGIPPRLRVDPTGKPRIVGPPMSTATPAPYPSALWMLTYHRWLKLRHRAPKWTRPHTGPAPAVSVAPQDERLAEPDSGELLALPRAVASALSSAYGSSLTLVYLAEVGPADDVVIEPEEERLLVACAELQVACVSTRDPMLRARRQGIIGRGGPTRPLGSGHLNPHGHRLAAEAVWRTIGPKAMERGSADRHRR
jgi:hypothetical protein